MKGRQGLGFLVESGEVFSSQKRSETHLNTSTTAGTSYTTGYNRPPRVDVTSTVVTTHDFWIKTPDHRQVAVQLVNQDIPLAQGQKIAVIFATRLRKPLYFPVALVNHDAGHTWTFHLNNDLVHEISGPMKIWAIVISLGLVINWMHYASLNTFIVAAAFLLYRGGCLLWRNHKAEQRIKEHVAKLMADVGANRSMVPMALTELFR